VPPWLVAGQLYFFLLLLNDTFYASLSEYPTNHIGRSLSKMDETKRLYMNYIRKQSGLHVTLGRSNIEIKRFLTGGANNVFIFAMRSGIVQSATYLITD
jgi:hypothetical protein